MNEEVCSVIGCNGMVKWPDCGELDLADIGRQFSCGKCGKTYKLGCEGTFGAPEFFLEAWYP